ncbi:OmpA-OmpF porin, OOP family [Mariprofundus micogutta]|uniref:OmpA-OmpF porin, OOP family n=1 Tax=Mariprofundus micogutta TaxID=1921010 RepID=A0A1L8CNN0_9PROT|nr:OmpA family protein [Mariprofundus micogutta]GAV20503.1 OmpA-OmpF porin, OOP family [Mariprofundus micogutta]
MSKLKAYLIVLLLPLVSGCATIDEFLFDAHPDGTPIRQERAHETPVQSAPETVTAEPESVPEAANAQLEPEPTPVAEPVSEQLWVRITFKSGQTGLAPGARSALMKAAGKFKSQQNDQRIAVRGYCDDEPIGGYDGKQKSAHHYDSQLTLSQARADSVRDVLIKAGITSDKITATGHGATAFIADNATVEGRNKNRRVDIYLLGNQQ